MATSLAQPSSSAIEQVLSHLKGVRTSMRGWRACCPAHADRKPSLSISVGEQGQVLLKCFAGCSLERIVEAMGLTMTDLFPDAGSVADGLVTTSNNRHHTTLTLVDLALIIWWLENEEVVSPEELAHYWRSLCQGEVPLREVESGSSQTEEAQRRWKSH